MSKAILLADDSVTIQKVIELTFMDQDYQIDAVSSGDEALRRLEGGTPDLVIADVHMPGASGFDVARRSKEANPETPVLLLVGTFEPFEESDFESSGADEVLKKPFDSQELLRLVERLLPADEAASESPAEESPAEEDTAEEDAAPEPQTADLEDTGVFSLDDEAFADGSSEVSSEVLPPPDLASPGEEPVAGLAWEDQGETEDKDDDSEEDASGEDSEDDDSLDDEAEDDDSHAGAAVAVPAGGLSDEDVERIAVRVAELVGEKVSRDVAWEVIPDLAEVIIKQRLRELESEVE